MRRERRPNTHRHTVRQRIWLGILAAGLALAGAAACGGGEPQQAEPQEPEPAAETPEPVETREPVLEPEPEPEPEPPPPPKMPEYPVTGTGQTLWTIVDERLAEDLGRPLSEEEVKTLINRGVCQVYSQEGKLRHFYQLDGTPVPGVEPPSDRSPHRVREGVDTIVCDRVRAEEILADGPIGG